MPQEYMGVPTRAVQAATWTVEFPDGTEQIVKGPPDMTREAIYRLAVQEQKLSSGKIPSTFGGGFTRTLGKDPVTTGALLTGAGLATGGIAELPALGNLIVA